MSSKTIYLYLKTHNKTGLKYLGKTVKDPFTYQGSGNYWLNHINKHGYDVTTEVLFETDDMEEFKKVALEFSNKLNIVESNEFANLVVEQGVGGPTFTGKHHTEEAREKIRVARSKQIVSEETRQKLSRKFSGDNNPSKRQEVKDKISNALKGRSMTWAYERDDEHKKLMSDIRTKHNPGFSAKATCPHCNKEGQYAGMKQWHFDNCRHKHG